MSVLYRVFSHKRLARQFERPNFLRVTVCVDVLNSQLDNFGRFDAFFVDVFAVWREPFGDSYLELAATRQVFDSLNASLAKCLFSDERRSLMVGECTGDNLAGTGTTTINEYNRLDTLQGCIVVRTECVCHFAL